jgi:hypothetical protein
VRDEPSPVAHRSLTSGGAASSSSHARESQEVGDAGEGDGEEAPAPPQASQVGMAMGDEGTHRAFLITCMCGLVANGITMLKARKLFCQHANAADGVHREEVGLPGLDRDTKVYLGVDHCQHCGYLIGQAIDKHVATCESNPDKITAKEYKEQAAARTPSEQQAFYRDQARARHGTRAGAEEAGAPHGARGGAGDDELGEEDGEEHGGGSGAAARDAGTPGALTGRNAHGVFGALERAQKVARGEQEDAGRSDAGEDAVVDMAAIAAAAAARQATEHGDGDGALMAAAHAAAIAAARQVVAGAQVGAAAAAAANASLSVTAARPVRPATRTQPIELLARFCSPLLAGGSVELHAVNAGSAKRLGMADVGVMTGLMGQVIGKLTDHLELDAGWAIFFALPRLFFHPPTKTDVTMVEALRRRLQLFEKGKLQDLWREGQFERRLPTVKSWKERQEQTEGQRRLAARDAILDALANNNARAAERIIDDVPGARPGREEQEKLRRLLVPFEDVRDRYTLRSWSEQRGFHRPASERVAALKAKLRWGNAEADAALVRKWAPRLGSARIKRGPDGTGVRTEHNKPFYEIYTLQFALLGEAVAAHAISDGAKRTLRIVMMMSLLKKDNHGRYSTLSGIRPIGKCNRLLADMLRGDASPAMAALGAYLKRYGQYAIAIRSGGEAVSRGTQLLLEQDTNVIAAFCDEENAYCREDNDIAAEALLELREEVRLGTDLPKGVTSAMLVAACEMMLDDLAFYREEEGVALTVVDGKLESIPLLGGEIQGGLFSVGRYCSMLAMKLVKPLMEKYPWLLGLCIVDDLTLLMPVYTAARLAELPAVFKMYDSLNATMRGKAAYRKFNVLQHPRHIGTDLDVANIIGNLPRDPDTHELPTIARGTCKLNGVRVGWDRGQMLAHAEQEVQVLADRVKVLRDGYLPLIGLQRTFLLGRLCYRSCATLNHLMRNQVPEDILPALQHSAESQVELARAIVGASEEELPGAQFAYADETVGHPSSLAVESLHLGFGHGGCGFTNPTAVVGYAAAAGVIDTLPLMREMPLVSEHVPGATAWMGCGIPMYEAAFAVIEDLGATLAFAVGPAVYPEQWRFVVKRLLVDGDFYPSGVEELAGRHFQHVALVAAQQEMHAELVSDATNTDHARARLRSAAAFGSGNWLSIMNIPQALECDDMTFRHGLRKRLGLRASAVLPETRCRKPNCDYGPGRIMRNPPCYIGTDLSRRWLTAAEHSLGVHWDACKGGGYLTIGHNAVMRIYAEILRCLGYSVVVKEIAIGRKPGATKFGKRHAPQRLDALATNWMGKEGRTRLGIDTTIGGALIHSKLRRAARRDHYVVYSLEKAKEGLKAQLSHARGYDFMTAAFDSLGAWGAECTELVVEGFAAKLAAAQTDRDKWLIIGEKQYLVARISMVVQKRNMCILLANAAPLGGGFVSEVRVSLDSEDPPQMLDAM